MVLEVCAQSIESCLNAQKGGAWRIELCQALELGGLTPSSSLIQSAKNYLTLPVHVLIRPRPGSFRYTRIEKESMLLEIDNVKAMGADGVVVGALQDDETIDWEFAERIAFRAAPLDLTFHRAIDLTPDPAASVSKLADLGYNRILTSGGKSKAAEGIATIQNMIEAADDRIEIMVGSDVNAENIAQFAEIGVQEFHMSGSMPIEGARSDLFDLTYSETDPQAIRAAKKVIKALRRAEKD